MHRFLIALFVLGNYTAASDAASIGDVEINQALVEFVKNQPFSRNRIVKTFRHGEEDSVLIISTPNNKKLQPYPALYVLLDGAPHFLSGMELADINNNAVFIGLPRSNRIRDFITHLSKEAFEKADASAKNLSKSNVLAGTQFNKELTQSILPYLEKEYGPFSVKILVGGSLSGVSVLDIMTDHPESFDAYAALSPSLWYNGDYYKEKMFALSKKPTFLKNKCLLLTASEDEPSIAKPTRDFDLFIESLDRPSTFRYEYKRIFELSHRQAIPMAYFLVPPYVNNSSHILPERELANLTRIEFEKKIKQAFLTKTCIPHPNEEMTRSLYFAYGATLVKEKRIAEAFALYNHLKDEDAVKSLTLLGKDSFIFSAFKDLTKAQKDALARDYLSAYPTAVKELPYAVVHYRNFELAKYIEDSKLADAPHPPQKDFH